MNPKEEKKVLRICKKVTEFVKKNGKRNIFGDYVLNTDDLYIIYSGQHRFEQKLLVNEPAGEGFSKPIVAFIFDDDEIIRYERAKEINESISEFYGWLLA